MDVETFEARGHPLVTATHTTTLEITKDPEISPRATCIIAVSSNKGCAALSEGLKRAVREGAQVSMLIEVSGESFEVRGFGHPELSLDHPTEIVVRKSDYRCPRTLLINADTAAADLDRGLVRLLRNGNSRVHVTLQVI